MVTKDRPDVAATLLFVCFWPLVGGAFPRFVLPSFPPQSWVFSPQYLAITWALSSQWLAAYWSLPSASPMQNIEKDKRIYLLMRKVEHTDY